MAKDYSTLKLPTSLMKEVDEFIKEEILGYRSRAEFAADAIRDFIKEIKDWKEKKGKKRK